MIESCCQTYLTVSDCNALLVQILQVLIVGGNPIACKY